MTEIILSSQTDDKVKNDLQTLISARKKAHIAMRSFGNHYWHAKNSLNKIDWAIRQRRIEIGQRRASKCPAFGKEAIYPETPDFKFSVCNGRIGRPGGNETLIYLNHCSTCKLKYSEIEIKMVMLKLNKEDRRRV